MRIINLLGAYADLPQLYSVALSGCFAHVTFPKLTNPIAGLSGRAHLITILLYGNEVGVAKRPAVNQVRSFGQMNKTGNGMIRVRLCVSRGLFVFLYAITLFLFLLFVIIMNTS